MHNDSYNFYVHKYNVFDRDFLINTIDKIPPTGYRSVYAIRQEDAERLRKIGFAGYKGTVWSPVLSVDVDSFERGEETAKQLEAVGYSFRMWKSGYKGVHFEIDRVCEPSEDLPYFDKKWVERNIPGADTSIYAHLHMFRLPGTRHLETGNKKELIKGCYGKPIIYQDSDKVKVNIEKIVEKYLGNKSIFNDEVLLIWTSPATNGERHEILTKIATKLRYQYQEPKEFVERYLHHTNLLFDEPKSNEEINRIVEHFYGK